MRSGEGVGVYTDVYYESRKRELKRRLVNEGRCDERLKAKVEESTFLADTGLLLCCSRIQGVTQQTTFQ